ncbi:DNA-binding domain-containing protein [Ectothiorhodospira haloalkaliphila]|uniref:HvfC/BufC N-terminal domain-containing protein n=1 Tax=Ectothiorhodospira haloalkaliphila TaxID=421628 RepID=UPI00046D328F|nr:DNA-binding domain-containing protein [Ectothiorhodospira haloalkaliphila]
MPSQAEYEADFVQALRQPQTPPPAGVRHPGSQPPALRFGVYRNNVHVSLVEAVTRLYPVVQRLVGEAFFQAVARRFVGQVLPDSPVLIDYGETFPDFLDHFEPAARLPYLGDVARIEWAWHRAYHAQDQTPLPPQAVARIPPAQVGHLRLGLHPSLQVLESPWPALSIWHTNRHDAQVRRIDRDSGSEATLVCRPDMEVLVCAAPLGTAALVRTLSTGANLEQAATQAVEQPGFNLQTSLAVLLSSGGITAFRF